MAAVTGLDYKWEVSVIKWWYLSMAFAGVWWITPLKILNSKSWLFCWLCEDKVAVSNGGYYSLVSDNAKKLSIRGKISVCLKLKTICLLVWVPFVRNVFGGLHCLKWVILLSIRAPVLHGTRRITHYHLPWCFAHCLLLNVIANWNGHCQISSETRR